MNIEELRTYCLSLPGAKEDIKWENDLCFCIGEKMFAITGLEGGGLTLKVEPESFGQMTEMEGIRPAPYLARYQWISIDDMEKFPAGQLQEWIQRSYELVKAKLPLRVRKNLGIS